MIRLAALLVATALLTACGTDGAPFVPSVSTGLTVGSGGVSTSTSLSASNGTISVGLGL